MKHSQNRLVGSLLAIVIVVTLACRNEPSAGSVGTAKDSSAGVADNWFHSYEKGITEAKSRNSPVLLDFGASWCPPCKLMDSKTFTDSAVKSQLENYVVIKVDVDKEPAVAQSWQISRIPRIVILDAEQKIIFDQTGFIPPTEFSSILKTALQSGDGSRPLP